MSRSPPLHAQPLSAAVATGRDNVLRLAPFRIVWLECPDIWNTCAERLAVSYEINDPNSRIRMGRLLYYRRAPRLPGMSSPAPPAVGTTFQGHPRYWFFPAPELVHVHTLAIAQITHGIHHLSEAQRWDGMMTTGQDAGQRVTPDRTPVTVALEIWNTNAFEPRHRLGDGVGPTGRENEYLARARVRAHFSVVRSAKWTTNWCIPYDDPDDPVYGWTRMDIELCNVPSGTPARILVARLGDPLDDVPDNRVYACSSLKPSAQPGLENLIVRGNRIRTPDGHMPRVNFSEYDENWKYPGNNFYGFWIALGDDGDWMPASEINWRSNEEECNHMRFTVYMHCGDALPERARAVNRLHRMFSQTKYFRSYKATRPYGDYALLHRRFRYRYICLFIGHGWGDCWHPFHPRKEDGRPVDHTHRGFVPDQYVCPDELVEDAESIMQAESEHYSWRIEAGCGYRSHYRTMPVMGHGVMLWNNFYAANDDDDVVQIGRPEQNAAEPSSDAISLLRSEYPRFLFHAGGCRTIAVDKLAEAFNANGTRYFHGWQYSVFSNFNIDLPEKVLTEWVKKRGTDFGADEWDPNRFLAVYNEYAAQTEYGSHELPRLRSAGGIVAPRANPSGASETMR